MASISEALAIALRHHQGGRLQMAEQLYRQILQRDPDQADAMHLLGVIANQVGRHEAAVAYIGRAIALKGNVAEYHNNLARGYRDLRRLPEAVAGYRRALELQPDFAVAHNNLGNAVKEQGKLEEAAACFRRAVAYAPEFAEAHNNLGLALKDQGKLEEAVACFRRALALKPEFAEVHSNLGLAFLVQARLDEAIACFRRGVELKPDLAEAHDGLGVACKAQGKPEEAVVCYRRALEELKPDMAGTHNNLGLALMEQGNAKEAVACFDRARALQPDFAEAHNNLGLAFMDQRKTDEAVVCFRQALELKPDFAEVHSNLGLAFMDQAKLEEAAACFRRAVTLKPDFAEAHHNLGAAEMDQGRPEEGAVCYRRAIELKPDFGGAHNNLGLAFLEQGQPEEALACIQRAVELDPDFAEGRQNRGAILLLLGQYEEGWREYEHRFECLAASRKFSKPRWHGERTEGRTILISREQGFGDTLQFVRYAPLVRERAGARRVILETPPALVRLFAQNNGWDAEIVSGSDSEQTVLPAFDCQVPLLSLPLALGWFEPLPMVGEYIVADPALRRGWEVRLGAASAIRVGLVWAGNPAHQGDRLRSMRGEKLRPLLSIPGFQFYSLQIGPRSRQAQPLVETGLIDLTMHLADFADTAAFVAELDLIISVDTAIAHLAGAMGRPVWTLLPFQAEWRWGVAGERTPWYPTMRLFRQPTYGDWDALVQRVLLELSRFRPGPQHP